MKNYILSLDQGTTSSRAILFDHQGNVLALCQEEFKQYYPKPGWVEHDADEIWQTQYKVAKDAIKKANISSEQVAAIGITNQRETTVVWNKTTGRPIFNAIVWQDRRTSALCDSLKDDENIRRVQQKTGLIIDAYFSGTKIKWILDHVEGARQLAEEGQLAFGTIDSWLVWNLTKGATHITDVTNASRTMLYDIHRLCWDDTLLKMLDIPASVLPEVKSSSEVYAHTAEGMFDTPIPVAGMAGDQQAALFGQMCTRSGMIKNTYGTGSFVMLNTGEKVVTSKHNLLSTIAWQINGNTQYALEGSIFIAGAIVQWLRDGLGIIQSSTDIEKLARTVEDNGGIYLVPALTGLGAPHWDQYARGTIIGITRGTTAGHIARAAVESIAYQALDVLRAMASETDIGFQELRVDGGASANDALMQFQANLLQIPVIRPKIMETTALGAAYLAGLAVGYWKNIEELEDLWQMEKTFSPDAAFNSKEMVRYWDKAVGRSKHWIEE